jgi:hypothetical protein
MHITLVKKIKASGEPCKKCAEVIERLEKDGLMGRISKVVVADERNPNSDGMRLAALHKVDVAPFFVVERPGSPPQVYISFFRFLKEVLQAPSTAAADVEEAKEILSQNPDIDFI